MTEATEAELLEARANAYAETLRIDAELLSPRFGWTTDPPPRTGIIETAGFGCFVKSMMWGEETRTHREVMPGVVDASVYEIPPGTLWRTPRSVDFKRK